MFTGLIERTAPIVEVTERGNYRIVTIECNFGDDPLAIGESIAIDGACMTVVSMNADQFTVEISQESLARTKAGAYRVGDHVNLERALRAGDRLGGHFVTGHVDTIGRIGRVDEIGESWVIHIAYDDDWDRLVVAKGSIAVDGISLTVNTVERGGVSVNIIPHTQVATNLSAQAGASVNLEFDLLAKHILRAHDVDGASSLTADSLKAKGWT